MVALGAIKQLLPMVGKTPFTGRINGMSFNFYRLRFCKPCRKLVEFLLNKLLNCLASSLYHYNLCFLNPFFQQTFFGLIYANGERLINSNSINKYFALDYSQLKIEIRVLFLKTNIKLS